MICRAKPLQTQGLLDDAGLLNSDIYTLRLPFERDSTLKLDSDHDLDWSKHKRNMSEFIS